MFREGEPFMTTDELLAAVRPELLVEFSARASLAEHLPVARWIGQVLVRELSRRRGEAVRAVPPLALGQHEVEFALEWLDFTADHFAEAGADLGDAGMLMVAALVHHVGDVVKQRVALPLQ